MEADDRDEIIQAQWELKHTLKMLEMKRGANWPMFRKEAYQDERND